MSMSKIETWKSFEKPTRPHDNPSASRSRHTRLGAVGPMLAWLLCQAGILARCADCDYNHRMRYEMRKLARRLGSLGHGDERTGHL